MSTKIEWTQETWNPVTGCTKVSEGCRHCYAATFAGRHMGAWKRREFSDVRCHPERLGIPGHWRRPRQVFVNSMSDLFHPAVSFDFIDRVFDSMIWRPRHTFQILTKRPAIMRDYMQRYLPGPDRRTTLAGIPLSPPTNVWLGVSVETQATAETRVPLLLWTPAAHRFISCEPLLEPVDLDGIWGFPGGADIEQLAKWPIRWVIVGGESGGHARPCEVSWIRSLIGQCWAADVPCFVKQLGSDVRGICDWPHHDDMPAQLLDENGCDQTVGHPPFSLQHTVDDAWWPCRLKLKARKGNDPAEWPEDLRVRQMPGGGR